MNVIFIEPAFPANQRQFVRGLHKAGANVIGIGERPADWLDDELKSWLGGYEKIGSVVDEQQLLDAVRRVQSRLWVDRMEATVEAHIMAAARVREAATIPGTSVHTAFLCRDKPAMKTALSEAGVPCARSTGADNPAAAKAFARKVGYPLILKPRDGAGAQGTYRVTNDAEFDAAIKATGIDRGVDTAIEEFIEGHEGYYDTLTIDGRVCHDFVTHYYPNVLDAMRTRWISPQMITTNRIDAPGYKEVRTLGARVIETLGIGTSATHMEWFFGSRGLKFSELGCRPPGVSQWDVYNAANDMDLYHEWGSAIVNGRPAGGPSRRYSAGLIALRPDCDGNIVGYDGAELIAERYNDNIVAAHLPDPGTPTQPVEAGYMANAWVRVRHPDYDVLRGILDDIGRTLKVRAR